MCLASLCLAVRRNWRWNDRFSLVYSTLVVGALARRMVPGGWPTSWGDREHRPPYSLVGSAIKQSAKAGR